MEGVKLDVISWVTGLVAGAMLPLPKAICIAVGTSVLIRLYQYFLAEPRAWGEFPADWIGGAAMILASCLFAYIGSIFKARRDRRVGSEGGRV